MIAYGHSDLSARLGVHLQLEHPTFKAAVRRIAEACNAHGKLARGSAETEAQIEEYLAAWVQGVEPARQRRQHVSRWPEGAGWACARAAQVDRCAGALTRAPIRIIGFAGDLSRVWSMAAMSSSVSPSLRPRAASASPRRTRFGHIPIMRAADTARSAPGQHQSPVAAAASRGRPEGQARTPPRLRNTVPAASPYLR